MLIDHASRPVDPPPESGFDIDSSDRRCRLAVRTQGLQPRQDLAASLGVAVDAALVRTLAEAAP